MNYKIFVHMYYARKKIHGNGYILKNTDQVICGYEDPALYNCHPHFAFPIHLLSPTIVVHQSFTIVIQFLFYLQM